jgi:hypothetical protein
LLILFGWVECSYALSAASANVNALSVSIRDLLFTLLGVIIGVMLWSMSIFYAWRWLRVLRELFPRPPPSAPPG